MEFTDVLLSNPELKLLDAVTIFITENNILNKINSDTLNINFLVDKYLSTVDKKLWNFILTSSLINIDYYVQLSKVKFKFEEILEQKIIDCRNLKQDINIYHSMSISELNNKINLSLAVKDLNMFMLELLVVHKHNYPTFFSKNKKSCYSTKKMRSDVVLFLLKYNCNFWIDETDDQIKFGSNNQTPNIIFLLNNKIKWLEIRYLDDDISTEDLKQLKAQTRIYQEKYGLGILVVNVEAIEKINFIQTIAVNKLNDIFL